MPDWDRLWDDFIQEELQDKDLQPKQKASDDDVALASRMKGKKKDLNKVKCFNSGEMDHFSSRCPKKKKGDDEKIKGKQAALIANKAKMDELVRRLEDEEENFAMISYFS